MRLNTGQYSHWWSKRSVVLQKDAENMDVVSKEHSNLKGNGHLYSES